MLIVHRAYWMSWTRSLPPEDVLEPNLLLPSVENVHDLLDKTTSAHHRSLEIDPE